MTHARPARRLARVRAGAARATTLAALALAAPLDAHADTSGVGPAGFVVTVERPVDAPPDALWRAITQLPQWWSSRHTWSGNAANLSVDLRPGGCWCETWAGGGALHGTVVFVAPGKMVRFYANLGPLQDRATAGVLTLSASPVEGRTVLKVLYRVSGPVDAGLGDLAPAVDRVLTEQAGRLVALAERGKVE